MNLVRADRIPDDVSLNLACDHGIPKKLSRTRYGARSEGLTQALCHWSVVPFRVKVCVQRTTVTRVWVVLLNSALLTAVHNRLAVADQITGCDCRACYWRA